MNYQEIKPCEALEPYIHSFWKLTGNDRDKQWERIFPDGCPGIVINAGELCQTDNGLVTLEHGKTYVVGAMTSFKDSFINSNTHLVGVCLKPAVFSSFYSYAPQNELTDVTLELDSPLSLDIGKILKEPVSYLNRYFLDRNKHKNPQLQYILEDIHSSRGKLSIYEIAKRNCTTVRQLERNFKVHIGLTPKEYTNIVRFQAALSIIRNAGHTRSLSDIAFECGYYDHAHLTNEIKRHTGLTPSQL